MAGPPDREMVPVNVNDLQGRFVILDANALIAPFQQNFNLDLELEVAAPGVKPVVPTSVIRELENLIESQAGFLQISVQFLRDAPL